MGHYQDRRQFLQDTSYPFSMHDNKVLTIFWPPFALGNLLQRKNLCWISPSFTNLTNAIYSMIFIGGFCLLINMDRKALVFSSLHKTFSILWHMLSFYWHMSLRVEPFQFLLLNFMLLTICWHFSFVTNYVTFFLLGTMFCCSVAWFWKLFLNVTFSWQKLYSLMKSKRCLKYISTFPCHVDVICS